MAKLSRNFDSSEFVNASHSGCEPSDPFSQERWWAENILQPLRNAFGNPIRISSYNRCIPGSIGVGGHGLGGQAVDFYPLNVSDPVAKMREMVTWLATFKADLLGKVLLEITPPHIHATTKGPESFRAGGRFQALEELASGDWLVMSSTAPEVQTAQTQPASTEPKEDVSSETYKEPKQSTGVTLPDLANVFPTFSERNRLIILGSLGMVGGIALARVL